MKRLLSILIPAYNAEKWVAASIQSAIDQTWPHKEVIVVDDGSSDSTYQIAARFESSTLKVLRQPNSGASATRNRALSLAQGDFIQWLDADDILDPNKTRHQMEFAETVADPGILISGAWGKFQGTHRQSQIEPNALWEDLAPAEWLFNKIDLNLWMAIESWLVSRKLTEMAGPWNESLSLDDDGEYFTRVLSKSTRIKFISESLSYVRRGAVSLSNSLSLNNQKLDSLAFSLESYINTMLAMEDSDRTRAACLKLLNRWVFYFYPERPDLNARMHDMASRLGGRLEAPTLRRKYRWIASVFGWQIGKKAQLAFPALKALGRQHFKRFIG